MSEWRLRGFVQDSDEEDEGLDSFSTTSSSTPPQRVASPREPPNPRSASSSPRPERSQNVSLLPKREEAELESPVKHEGENVQLSTISAPTGPPHNKREPTETPDPLQRSPTPKTPPVTQIARNTLLPDRVETADVHLHFPIFDSDDDLSEPPSEIDGPDSLLAPPQRRPEVQVVIPPPSTALVADTWERVGRSLRARKPIQVHPYILEQERYKRECQRRGIKPVSRPKSPPLRVNHDEDESQEQEFDPENASPSNSPPPRSGSTPARRNSGVVRRHYHSIGRRRSDVGGTHETLHSVSRSQPGVTSGNGRKRRKLNVASSASPRPLGGRLDGQDGSRIYLNAREQSDVWTIPQSPPKSSSPFAHILTSSDPELRKPPRIEMIRVPNLPTPSDSSGIQDEDPEPEDAPSTRRAGRFRPIVVSSQDSNSISSSSGTESERERESESESEKEAQLIKKKIRGVLPASWIRFDQQKQQKKKSISRPQSSHGRTPEREVPQRGVAQRVMRPATIPRRASTPRDAEIIEISDASDEDDTILPSRAVAIEKSVREAAELAAQYDRRYDIDDDDLASMENDRLPLYSLGGTQRGKKRKRQLKLTDAFPASKKQRVMDDRPWVVGGSSRNRRGHTARENERKAASSRKNGRFPPALSIIDVAEATVGNDSIPPFLKVAMRRVRQRADQGRHSPTNKHIRLSTLQDTEDACSTLRKWRNGEIRRKPNARPRLEERIPLTGRTAHGKQLPTPRTPVTNVRPAEVRSPIDISPRVLQKEGAVEDGSLSSPAVFTPTPKRPLNGPIAISTRGARRVIPKKAPTFRAAQLEGLESENGRSASNIRFQRGLQRTDLRRTLGEPSLVPTIHPQPARVFAEDDSALPPPMPNEEASGLTFTEVTNENGTAKRTRHRRLHKQRAQRVDTEAREYRQPNEPGPVDFIDNEPGVPDTAADHTGLDGLAPYGTVYPTSFDISPLPVGTYFHRETFIGQEELKKALLISERDLDIFAGHHIFQVGSEQESCGPWTDETWSRVASSFDILWNAPDPSLVAAVSSTLRSLIKYISTNLSFLDPIDRKDFVARMKDLLSLQFERVLSMGVTCDEQPEFAATKHETIRPLAYILVLSLQAFLVARHTLVEPPIRDPLTRLMLSAARTIIQHIIRRGIPDLGAFLERKRSLLGRESGIQDKDILAESVVICMTTLRHAAIPGSGFWDLVSHELSTLARNTKQVKKLESIWATAFTLLPFVEIDASGVLVPKYRFESANENWGFVKEILQQVFSLYPASKAGKSSSLNEYVRATLKRCHELIKTWHWVRCDAILTKVLAFFAKRHYRPLSLEEIRGSPAFLQDLGEEHQLNIALSDSAFHIFLKGLALGLKGMRSVCPEKTIRSFVFRSIPNHGRTYLKEQSLSQETLDELRNNHDLLCTLYWASTPFCRPKIIASLRRLVDHEVSHREACRLNVRAWANLTLFQLSTEQTYEAVRPFAEWHKEIMEQTLTQYRLAKTEADEYLKLREQNGSADIDIRIVHLTMVKNQEQVIATLRDCVAGIHRAVQKSPRGMVMRNFLVDSAVVQLLELIHVDDKRLSTVIRETLTMLRTFIAVQNKPNPKLESQSNDEESQDYGDFPDMEDLDDIGKEIKEDPVLHWIESPLWHLLSNAFGTESMPDDNLLMECVDTWVELAACQVTMGSRSWSHYVGSFSPVSWQHLRDTEQSRKFGPYFMATLLRTNSAPYDERRSDFMGTLLVSLVEREALLRFQHRLLHALVQSNLEEPLLKNIPFYQNKPTGEFDITADTLKQRRLSLLSSILANMQDDIHRAMLEEPHRAAELKREYASLLDNMMLAMKSNYLQLGQGSTVTGAYVEFVQRIVHFLKQYTSDICTVNAFFTDSVSFPLPATDPHYVVGRLCGYAPRLQNPGITTQLVTFIHTVAQQSAKDNHSAYFVRQLSTALANEDDSSTNISALRSLFLQDIAPAYVEAAFSSIAGLVIAKPILQSLKAIMKVLPFELQINDDASVENIMKSICSMAYAFIRGVEPLKQTPSSLTKPAIMHAISLMLDAMGAAIPTLEYIIARTLGEQRKHAIVVYCTELIAFLRLGIEDSHVNPNDLNTAALRRIAITRHPSDVQQFCTRNLEDSLRMHWTETGSGAIFFGHGHARKEVLVDVGTMEEEKWRLERVGREFAAVVRWVYDGDGDEDGHGEDARRAILEGAEMGIL